MDVEQIEEILSKTKDTDLMILKSRYFAEKQLLMTQSKRSSIERLSKIKTQIESYLLIVSRKSCLCKKNELDN